MSFVSLPFLILFVLCLCLCAAVDASRLRSRQRLRHWVLLIASYVFYGWWDWRFCLLMLGLTVIAWQSAKLLRGRFRRAAITVGVAVPLLILGIFKYLNFFLDSFARVFGLERLGVLSILLPVGISFYTFQSMSYTIDVYRGRLPAAGLGEVCLYVAFFPQLVAGPIVKAQEFIPQLRQERRVTLAGLEAGLQIFLMGMFRKVVLADRLSVFADDVFAAPAAFSSLTVFLGVAAYTLQIYFDFCGYSDMAIGCAKALGYDLAPNFNLPYLSKNPTEFWKRWHISLSSWLQEYLYIPLGGNRKGRTRTYVNLMLTMLLGGLWHGASWTFVLWGGLHGLALCLHKLVKKAAGGRKILPDMLCMALNTAFAAVCWVFFRAESFGAAMTVLGKLFVWSGGVTQLYTWLFFALGAELIYTLWCVRASRGEGQVSARYFRHDLGTFRGLLLFFLEIMLTLSLAYTGGSPFIYFQF